MNEISENNSKVDDQIIHEITALDSAPVECDGFARLAVKVLNQHKQDYTVLLGKVADCDGNEFSPHMYIDWGIYIIDFMACLWLGAIVLVGFLNKSNYCHLYAGREIQITPLPDAVEALMLYQPSQDKMNQLRANSENNNTGNR